LLRLSERVEARQDYWKSGDFVGLNFTAETEKAISEEIAFCKIRPAYSA
jgi:hypothetical protein